MLVRRGRVENRQARRGNQRNCHELFVVHVSTPFVYAEPAGVIDQETWGDFTVKAQ